MDEKPSGFLHSLTDNLSEKINAAEKMETSLREDGYTTYGTELFYLALLDMEHHGLIQAIDINRIRQVELGIESDVLHNLKRDVECEAWNWFAAQEHLKENPYEQPSTSKNEMYSLSTRPPGVQSDEDISEDIRITDTKAIDLMAQVFNPYENNNMSFITETKIQNPSSWIADKLFRRKKTRVFYHGKDFFKTLKWKMTEKTEEKPDVILTQIKFPNCVHFDDLEEPHKSEIKASNRSEEEEQPNTTHKKDNRKTISTRIREWFRRHVCCCCKNCD